MRRLAAIAAVAILAGCRTSPYDHIENWVVREVRDAASRRRYRMQWGREMPDGMLKRSDGQDNGGN